MNKILLSSAVGSFPAVAGASSSTPVSAIPASSKSLGIVPLPPAASRVPLKLFGVLADRSRFESRSLDGTGNNPTHGDWGSVGRRLLRKSAADYADGLSSPAGGTRKSAREISNIILAQRANLSNARGTSDILWIWGQFLDHDMDHTVTGSEAFPVAVPKGDPAFDPSGTGTATLRLSRSEFDPATGVPGGGPREQINGLTAFIDASQVYDVDPARSLNLRLNDGTGKLKTSGDGKFMPRSPDGAKLFIAGDSRANEQLGLTAIHTLFVLEHNRLCDELKRENPELTENQLFETARKIVGAYVQAVTYNEFLPLLLGEGALKPYAGYDATVNPGINNEFSTAGYRIGHTMLSDLFLRIDDSGQRFTEELWLTFQKPELFISQGGTVSVLRGAAQQRSQEIDAKLVNSVRNLLFADDNFRGGTDLGSLNIQRGRDHGLPGYNAVRAAYGLKPVTDFSEINSDPAVQAALREAYGDVNQVDLWLGGLAENHAPGALVGELVRAILVDQFSRLRDGDRFWYQNDPFFADNPDLMKAVLNTTLADLIRRNTSAGAELRHNVFLTA